MYSKVLPKVEALFRSAGIDISWPEFYGMRGTHGGHLMNDLNALGYKLLDRKRGLDFDSAALVLESLARYHAATAVLLERSEITKNDFFGYFFAESRETTEGFYGLNIQTLATTLEKRWRGEWVEYADRLRRFGENIFEKLQSAFNADYNSKFKVLSHGDLWVSNVLFMLDKNEKPLTVKFLDFPLAYVGGPGADVDYFLSTSLRLSEFSRIKDLHEHYFQILLDYLKIFDFYSEPPTFEEFEGYLKAIRIHGFVAGLVLRPMIMLPSEKTANVEELCEQYLSEEFKSPCGYDYEGEEYVTSLKFFIKKGEDEGLI